MCQAITHILQRESFSLFLSAFSHQLNRQQNDYNAAYCTAWSMNLQWYTFNRLLLSVKYFFPFRELPHVACHVFSRRGRRRKKLNPTRMRTLECEKNWSLASPLDFYHLTFGSPHITPDRLTLSFSLLFIEHLSEKLYWLHWNVLNVSICIVSCISFSFRWLLDGFAERRQTCETNWMGHYESIRLMHTTLNSFELRDDTFGG